MLDQSEPNLDVVQQEFPQDSGVEEITRIIVPVRPVGPTTTQQLAARIAIAGYLNTAVGVVSQLAPADLRRKNIRILLTQACYVGHVKQLVQQAETAQLTAGTVLTLEVTDAIYVMPVTTAGIASYWIAQWAD